MAVSAEVSVVSADGAHGGTVFNKAADKLGGQMLRVGGGCRRCRRS